MREWADTNSSAITYTSDKWIHVEVRTDVEDPITNIPKTSNFFYFTFTVDSPLEHQVMPKLYEDAMRYIESKRRINKLPDLDPTRAKNHTALETLA